MEKTVKVILAILFFLCLLDMPYGFYQLVRFAALVGFAVLAYRANEEERKTEMIVYVCLAILFQPCCIFSKKNSLSLVKVHPASLALCVKKRIHNKIHSLQHNVIFHPVMN